MRDLDIAIVGGGIGGLATALGLARAGFRPTVYEQVPALGEVGAGLSITPNSAKGLYFLGVGEALEREADEPRQQLLRHWKTNEVLLRIDRSGCRAHYGGPYLMIHRADLHRILADAFRALVPKGIRLNVPVAALRQGAGGVELATKDGTTIRAGLVIAADGLRSAVRAHLFGDDKPRFTGQVAYRGLIPRAALAGLAIAEGSCVWAGPGRVFLRYPLRHGALMNCVVLERTEDWVEESWSVRADVNELKAKLADWPDEPRALAAAIAPDQFFKWGLFDRAPLPALHVGRVALIGDAAHPMLPFHAQGAASAIEDAVVLARCLAAAGTPEAALARYEAARRTRVTMLQVEAAKGGQSLQAPDPERFKTRTPENEDALGIFHYDPATVPI
jgi:salicylate hydroxylase